MEAIHQTPATRREATQLVGASRRLQKNTKTSLVPAIRTALTKDVRLYEFLVANAGALRRQQPAALHHLTRRCMQWRELEQPRDGEVCRHLGCAMGARLERLAPNIPREDGDVFGILVEVAYAYLAGALPITDLERSITLIESLGFRLFTPELYALSSDAVRRAKQDRTQPMMVLLKGIGHGAEPMTGDPSLVDHAIRLIESWGAEAVHWAGVANCER